MGNDLSIDGSYLAAAFQNSSNNYCEKDYKLDEVSKINSSNNTSKDLALLIAEEILPKYYEKRYSALNAAQRQYAEGEVAKLIRPQLKGKKLSNLMGFWDWHVGHRIACWGESDIYMPKNVRLTLNWAAVSNILYGPEIEKLASKPVSCQAAQIVPTLVLKENVSFGSGKKGQALAFTPVELVYADQTKIPSTLPGSCGITVKTTPPQTLAVSLEEIKPAQSAEANVTVAAGMTKTPVQPLIIKVTPEGKINIAEAGSYDVELTCQNPAYTLPLGTLEIKEAGKGKVSSGGKQETGKTEVTTQKTEQPSKRKCTFPEKIDFKLDAAQKGIDIAGKTCYVKDGKAVWEQ